MGYNLVWICNNHKVFDTSMRGEEGIDFQYLMRSGHASCFGNGSMQVLADMHMDRNAFESEGFKADGLFGEHEGRPAVLVNFLRSRKFQEFIKCREQEHFEITKETLFTNLSVLQLHDEIQIGYIGTTIRLRNLQHYENSH